MEWKLFEGNDPEQSTFAYHEHRDRAPHIDQDWHRGRMERAVEFVELAVKRYDCQTVVDLGAGDGGMLSLIHDRLPHIATWGYEFTPANVAGARERGVTVVDLDFANNLDRIIWGHVLVMTETLEHVRDPHGILRHAASMGVKVLVASSPWNEMTGNHDACHVWAWDPDGYAQLITDAGFDVVRHDKVSLFQVVMAVRR